MPSKPACAAARSLVMRECLVGWPMDIVAMQGLKRGGGLGGWTWRVASWQGRSVAGTSVPVLIWDGIFGCSSLFSRIETS